jgi:uncharacterized membrane protein
MTIAAPTAEAPAVDVNVQSTKREPTGPFSAVRTRVDSIDLLRGLVMVIMLLDHTRDFIHRDAIYFQDPTDLSTTNPILFFTRWITHFCAPVFVFLAGTGAYMQLARGKSKPELSRFLLTRGLWLIVLEFTVVRLGLTFNLNYEFFGLVQVIWVIGLSMIVLSALIYLPVRWIALFAMAMIFLHNLLDRFQVAGWQGPGSPVPPIMTKVFMILHQPAAFPVLWFFPSPVVFLAYPFVPWVGVMAGGFAFGALYRMDGDRRRRILLRMGIASVTLFILLRALNVYGDPVRWSSQRSVTFTLLSFMNVTKYPPSLLYLLATLGPAFIFLALVEGRKRGVVGNALVTFGRVPLFYYILQWYVAHGFAVLLGLLAGQPVAWQFSNVFLRFGNQQPGLGFRLWVVYVAWILGVLLLYPLCKWFAGVKRRRTDWWLSYL